MKSKKLLSTIFVVLILTIFSKVFGLIRNSLIGSNFGVSAESDAYMMAIRITTQLFMTLGSAITATAIPIIIGHNAKGDHKKSSGFVSNAMTTLVAITAIITLIGIGLAPLFVKLFAFGFDQHQMTMTIGLTRIMFPILVLIPGVYLFVSILQSQGTFSVTSIISIPYNFVIITYLLFFSATYGIYGLGVATVLGWLAQALVQLPFVIKKGFKYKVKFDLQDPDIRKFFILIVPILMSSAVYNVNALIDNAIASTLLVGKLSALSYAFVVYTAISSTIIYGVSTVLFPNFSEYVSTDDISGLKKNLLQIIKGMTFIVVPMIFGLSALKVEVIQLIYLRGNFTIDDAILTAGPLGYYMIGMIGFAFQDIFNKVFFAMKNTKLPLRTSMISITINIILNIILVQFFDLNGLAMATSIAVIANGLMLYYALNKEIGTFDHKDLMKSLTKITFAGLIMFLSVKIFTTYIAIGSLIISTALAVIIGVVVYALVTLILGVDSAHFIINIMQKIINKVGGKFGTKKKD